MFITMDIYSFYPTVHFQVVVLTSLLCKLLQVTTDYCQNKLKKMLSGILALFCTLSACPIAFICFQELPKDELLVFFLPVMLASGLFGFIAGQLIFADKIPNR
jgi:hypothetical protein